MRNTVAHELVQRSLLGEALDPGPVAVFVADDDQKYLAVNAYACTLLGYSRKELLALQVTEVAVNEGAAEDFDAMLRAGSGAGSTILRHRDGTEIPMRYLASATTIGGIRLWVSVCWPD